MDRTHLEMRQFATFQWMNARKANDQGFEAKDYTET